MHDSVEKEGRNKTGIRELVRLPVSVVEKPVRLWLERRAERKEIESRSRDIKHEAGARMRDFHDALWDRWGPELIEEILKERKETK